MPPLNLIKRSELTAPLNLAEFDSNLTALEAAVNDRVEVTDPRLTNARAPTAHTHTNAELPELAAALAAKASASTVVGILDTLGNLQDAVDAIPNVTGVRTTVGHPGDELGIDGDYAFDVTPGSPLVLYGPKGVSPATPGHWPATGVVLLSPGDGTFEFITEIDLVTRANAGTLSPVVAYRIPNTDQTATVLVGTVVPNVVLISSPTIDPRLLIDKIEGGVLSSSNPTWDVIFDSPIGA